MPKPITPAACNAIETLLFTKRFAAEFLPPIILALQAQGVEIRLDELGQNILDKNVGLNIKPAAESDWSTGIAI